MAEAVVWVNESQLFKHTVSACRSGFTGDMRVQSCDRRGTRISTLIMVIHPKFTAWQYISMPYYKGKSWEDFNTVTNYLLMQQQRFNLCLDHGTTASFIVLNDYLHLNEWEENRLLQQPGSHLWGEIIKCDTSQKKAFVVSLSCQTFFSDWFVKHW